MERHILEELQRELVIYRRELKEKRMKIPTFNREKKARDARERETNGSGQ